MIMKELLIMSEMIKKELLIMSKMIMHEGVVDHERDDHEGVVEAVSIPIDHYLTRLNLTSSPGTSSGPASSVSVFALEPFYRS